MNEPQPLAYPARDVTIRKARVALATACLDLQEAHGLTPLEMVTALQAEQSQWLGMLQTAESPHSDDPS